MDDFEHLHIDRRPHIDLRVFDCDPRLVDCNSRVVVEIWIDQVSQVMISAAHGFVGISDHLQLCAGTRNRRDTEMLLQHTVRFTYLHAIVRACSTIGRALLSIQLTPIRLRPFH